MTGQQPLLRQASEIRRSKGPGGVVFSGMLQPRVLDSERP